MAILAVLPNDPVYKYYEKGEIKPRYYNPGNYFEEVHILSLSEVEIEPAKVQLLAGAAKLFMHPLGKPSLLSFPAFFPRVRRRIAQIAPDVIRAYNPRQGGALAVFAGNTLGIPTALSIHLEYDEQRKYDHRLLLRLIKPLEYYALRNVDAAICVTAYLQRYAQRYGAKRCVTIYNKVYAEQFDRRRAGPRAPQPVTILSIGRLDRQKYQECLLRAIQPLDVRLILIGQGELAADLKNLSKQLDIAHKVTFIPSVPNTDIQTYYWQADIFALATHYEGFCIPILEAMAAGLPIVASGIPPILEIMGTAGMPVENTPAAFERVLRDLVAHPARRRALGECARERAVQFSGKIMEQKEQALYQNLIDGTF